MIPFYLGLGLLLTAALFFLASMTVPALVCCGVGGAWMGALLDSEAPYIYDEDGEDEGFFCEKEK